MGSTEVYKGHQPTQLNSTPESLRDEFIYIHINIYMYI